MKYVVDTNFIYEYLDEILNYEPQQIVLMATVRQELDKHKTDDSEELRFKARKANGFIFDNYDHFTHDVGEYNAEEILGSDFHNTVPDNRIVASAVKNQYGIITGDLNMYSTAKAFDLEVVTLSERLVQEYEDYKGFIEVEMTDEELNKFHDSHLNKNIYELNLNQYLIIFEYVRDEDGEILLDENGQKIKDLKRAFRWDGEFHIDIKEKKLRSKALGEFKARDLYQACAIDAVINHQIVLYRGKAGTAKTQIGMAYAFQQLQAGKYSKLIIFSNALPTHSAFYHGLVKGDLKTKLLDSSIGNILASKLGSKDQVEALLLTEELMVLPASDIRGFDSTGMNAILYITEGQNWSRELMKLGVQRLGDDCMMIIEGDNNTQLDNRAFGGMNNGMRVLSKVFRNMPYYAELELQKIYRSPIAERAELMSDLDFVNNL